jgi:diguanylate cyclase (GGDEF)-like protein
MFPLRRLLFLNEELLGLLSARSHSPYLLRHRATVIIARVRLVSAMFAVLTPLWFVVDLWAFAWPTWGVLLGARAVSTLVFVALAWPWPLETTPARALVMLTTMLLNPPVYYLFSLLLFADVGAEGPDAIVAGLYSLLPIIIIAGLSVFPLTLLETALYAGPVLAMIAFGVAQAPDFTWAPFVRDLWLAFLMIGVAALASMGQLHHMMTLIARASIDPLTGVFTRRTGGEIIDLQFHIAARYETPFTILFVDLDDFKAVNDSYGHGAGDAVLRAAAESLRSHLRRADILVRWGGDEFVLALLNTDCAGARLVVRRILDRWLGSGPDGGPVTASIGAAERAAEGAGDWLELVEVADRRMSEAKKRGKHRCITCDGEEMA